MDVVLSVNCTATFFFLNKKKIENKEKKELYKCCQEKIKC